MTILDSDTLPLDLATWNYAVEAIQTLDQVIESLDGLEASTSLTVAQEERNSWFRYLERYESAGTM